MGNSQTVRLELLRPVIEVQSPGCPGQSEPLEVFEAPEEVPDEGFGGLDLEGKNPPALPDQEIDFVSPGIVVEKEVGSSSPVQAPFMISPTTRFSKRHPRRGFLLTWSSDSSPSRKEASPLSMK